MAFADRAVEDPAIVDRIAAILAAEWDPAGIIRDALRGEPEFYREHAVLIAGMLSADAREMEVQRYLRQLEQEVGPTTLHPAEARHQIAVALWRAARQL
jgi:hypothetical protein